MKIKKLKKRFLAVSLFSTAGLAVVPSFFTMTKTEQNQTIKPKIIKPTKKDWGFEYVSPVLKNITDSIFHSGLIDTINKSLVPNKENAYATNLENYYLPELFGVKNEKQLKKHFQNQINHSIFAYKEKDSSLKTWNSQKGEALKKETTQYLGAEEELSDVASIAVVYSLMSYLKTMNWDYSHVLSIGIHLILCLQNFSNYNGPKTNNAGETNSLISQITNWLSVGIDSSITKADFATLLGTNFAEVKPSKFFVTEIYNKNDDLYGSETYFWFTSKNATFASTVDLWNDDDNNFNSPEPFINPQMWFFGFEVI